MAVNLKFFLSSEWSNWSTCEVPSLLCGPNCGPGFKTRTRKCVSPHKNCPQINGKLLLDDKVPCYKQCEGNYIWRKKITHNKMPVKVLNNKVWPQRI